MRNNEEEKKNISYIFITSQGKNLIMNKEN